MDIKLRMKLEKIELGIEELTSLILMLDQALYRGDFSKKAYEMGVSHIVLFSQNLNMKFKSIIRNENVEEMI